MDGSIHRLTENSVIQEFVALEKFHFPHISSLAAGLCALAVLLTGCEFTPTDITSLMQPPKLTGSQQAIESALAANVPGKTYTLKYPLTGKYRTPFILHDIDGDGVKEAFVLYTPESDNAGTRIMVFKLIKGKWAKQCEISGGGNEVSSIDFGDYDGSGRQYLTVGWTLFNSTDFGLTVYGISQGSAQKLFTDTYTAMDVLDINGDKKEDLLLFNLETGSSKSQAHLIAYSAADHKLEQVATAPLDSTVSSYAGLYESKLLNGTNGVFIDGYKGAHSMVTELVYWKSGRLVAPFYNKSTGTASSTLRDVPIGCDDIDSDSYIEIPLTVELPGYENAEYQNKIYLVRWNSFTAQGTLSPKLSCIMNLDMGYYVQIPNFWENTVTVQSRDNSRTWVFRQYGGKDSPFSGNILFEITVYTQDQWNSLKSKTGLYKVQEDSNRVYVIKMGTQTSADASLWLTEPQLASHVKLYNQ